MKQLDQRAVLLESYIFFFALKASMQVYKVLGKLGNMASYESSTKADGGTI